MPEITRALTLSTAHITQTVCELLDTAADTATNRELPSPEFGDWRDRVVVSPTRYGAFVRRLYSPVEDPDALRLPACLEACLKAAEGLDCQWVLFDRDGDTLPDLQIHDW